MRGMPVLLLAIAATLAGCGAIPDAPKRQPLRQSTSVFTPSPQARQCLSQLGEARAGFTPLPDRYFDGGCATVNTVRLSSLQGELSPLALTNMGPVTCPVASTFAGWARFGADRAAQQILGSQLVRIETMGTFNCRNVAGSDRRSAHATGNAIDISGFVLADGRRITVRDDWTSGTMAERQFLRVIHQSACKRFGTVLGPAYNAAHADHFHVEPGGGGFCR